MSTEAFSPSKDTLRPSLLAAVFLVALSVLAFEVALSRAFSVLLRFHFVFLAISLATCGLGLGGLLDYLTGPSLARRGQLQTQLPLRAGLLALLYPLTIYLLFATPLAAHLTSVWIVSGVCLLPFLMAGTLLSRSFAEYAAAGGTLYFADLFGAALGSFLVIAGLQSLGATNVPFACGLAAALATACLAHNLPHSPRQRRTAFVGSAMLFVALAGMLAVNIQARLVDLPILPLRDDPAAKPLYQELGDPRLRAQIVYSEWNAFARTDVVRNARPDGHYDPYDDLYIYTDGEVPTNMLYFPGDLCGLRERIESFIGFRPFAWFRPRHVLLIGPGGGLDILLAAAAGAEQIVGVEINPSIPRIMRRFADFNGHLYERENVRIYVDEGRSFIRRSPEQYDLIYLALTKTATTASRSLALVEGYIYTQEAFADYLQHLTARGKIALVLQEPVFLLRSLLTALEALQAQGLSRADALRCLIVLSLPETLYELGPYRHMLIISRQPFGREESRRLAAEAIALGFEPGYFPGAYEPVPFSWLTKQQASTKEFVVAWNQWLFGEQRLNIAPCTDDRPFVADLTFRMPGQFIGLMLGALLLALLFSALAIWREGLRPLPTRTPSDAASALASEAGEPSLWRCLAGAVFYFSALGAGYMLIEIALIQKLALYLGYPVLSLSVILFALLLGSGLGSLISQRWPVRHARAVASYALGAVLFYGLAWHYSHEAIVAATLGADIRLRCLITMGMIVPLGIAMGMPFPTGLRAIGRRAQNFVPWMWGVNGLMSVVGSVGAMTIAKFHGFETTLWAGWAAYACALLGAHTALRSKAKEPTDDANVKA